MSTLMRGLMRRCTIRNENGQQPRFQSPRAGLSRSLSRHEVNVTSESTGPSNAPSPLAQAIVELQRLHEVLLSGDLEPRVLTDFRDALNRVRTAAWAAQQYMACKETEQDSGSVLSLLVGEGIRVTYQLCQAISGDLNRTDIEFQAGSLVQLSEVTKALTEQLNGVINKRE